MKTTLYQKTRKGKIQSWTIWVEPKGDSGFPEVWVEHGQVDGKKQTTFDIIKEGVNIGKANETSALEQAKLTVERKTKIQKEEGYCDTIEEANVEKSVDFAAAFPKMLCFYKPKNSIDDEKLDKLEKAGRVIKTIKRNGMMHIVRKTKKFGVEIYSRRMDLETGKYPHLVSAFESLPDDTILLGEMILIKKDGSDDFNGVSSICRSDPDEAISKQKTLGKVSYYIYDVAFKDKKNLLTSLKFGERIKLIESCAKQANSEYVLPVEITKLPLDKAMDMVKERQLEGMVLWDADGTIDLEDAFTFNGKAYRPNLVFKRKPKYEDDFIVRWNPEKDIGDYGNGKNKSKIKNVLIYQMVGDEEVCLGKCGGGLTDEDRDFYTDASKFPRVWQIEYDSVQPNTGALRFPVFKSDRTKSGDKEMSECLMSDTIKAARSQNAEEEDETE